MIRPSEAWVWRRLADGGAFVVHRPTGDHMTVNRAAADLLGALADGAQPADCAASLVDRYRIPPARATADVAAIIAALTDAGVLLAPEDDDVHRA